MDVGGVSSATLDVAAGGTSAIAVSVLAGTEKLMEDVVARLFASLGVGGNVNASA